MIVFILRRSLHHMSTSGGEGPDGDDTAHRKIRFDVNDHSRSPDMRKTICPQRNPLLDLNTDKAGSTSKLQTLTTNPPILTKGELNATLHLDLTTAIEEAIEEANDRNGEGDMVPESINAVIDEPTGSLVRLALSGVSIVGYQDKMISSTLASLENYMQQCISAGLLAEASYFESVIDTIKYERRELDREEDLPSIVEADECLQRAMDKLTKKELEWNRVEVQLRAEREVAISEVKLQRKEELQRLSEEWNAENMKRHFNKPSPYLLGLRAQLHRRMEMHEFTEALRQQSDVAARESQEAQIAGRRMYKAYRQAVRRVEEKYDQYLRNIDGVFERRKSDIDRWRGIALKPYRNRVAKFQTMKKNAQARSISVKMRRPVTAISYTGRRIRPPKSPCAKLQLPEFVPLPRRSKRNLCVKETK